MAGTRPASTRAGGALQGAEGGAEFALVEVAEASLVGADLDDGDFGVAGVDELLDSLDDRLDLRAAGHLPGHLDFGDGGREGFEVDRVGQIGLELPAADRPGELLVGELQASRFVRAVADVGLLATCAAPRAGTRPAPTRECYRG